MVVSVCNSGAKVSPFSKKKKKNILKTNHHHPFPPLSGSLGHNPALLMKLNLKNSIEKELIINVCGGCLTYMKILYQCFLVVINFLFEKQAWSVGVYYKDYSRYFFPMIADTQPPRIDRCISPSPFIIKHSQGKPLYIDWEEPLFSDNSQEPLTIHRTHKPGENFEEGLTRVTYTAVDRSNNNVSCVINIIVKGKTGTPENLGHSFNDIEDKLKTKYI